MQDKSLQNLKYRLVEELIDLYKAKKHIDREYQDVKKELVPLMDHNERVESAEGNVLLCQTESYKVNGHALAQACEKKRLDDIELAAYFNTEYSLTDKGKLAFKQHPLLQELTSLEINQRLLVRI